MARRSLKKRPENATILHNFAALREVLAAFATGSFALLVVMGRPGLTKSRHVKAALEGKKAGYIKGKHTHLDLYDNIYKSKDTPIVLDDTNALLADKKTREMIRDLTETDLYKKIEYGSASPHLARRELPCYFHTTSPVCFITNFWDSDDPIFEAMESRAEFFSLEVTWPELHRDVARWFWDQEIFDYVQKRLSGLREPDARIYVKAAERKRSNLRLVPWQGLIDNYCDDRHGIMIRNLIDSAEYSSDNERFNAYEEINKKDGTSYLSRSNFYARVKKIRLYYDPVKLRRIHLANTMPPIEERPKDGPVGGDGDE